MVWALATLAYLLGCIPSGLIVARFYGVDLRSSGSGNTGATNALRVAGKKAGAITLLGDMLKGTCGVYIAMKYAGQDAGYLAAGAAVLGHDFPVFMKFRGGKGVATSFGVLLALEPAIALIGFALWIATVIIWKYSSLGALVSFALMPPCALLLRGGGYLFLVTVILTGLIFVKHRANIGRLVKGEEPRVGRSAANAR